MRRLAAVTGLLAAAALSLGPLLAATPAAASGGPTLPLAVALVDLTPKAPQPHSTIRLTASLTNTSSHRLTALQAQLVIGGVVGNRSLLATLAANPSGYVGPPVAASLTAVPGGALAPGAKATVTVSVAADDLALQQAGVYPFGVQVVGDEPGTGALLLGRLRTFLPWAPPHSVPEPAQVAWVWPLVDRPHRATTTMFNDDGLASELAPHGRLAVLAATAAAAAQASGPVRPVPVTWALDPLLLQDANLMAHGYQVQRDGRTVNGPGAPAAAAWLSALRTAVSGADVLTLPYADVDVNALVRAGRAKDVQDAEVSGTQIAEKVLGRSLPTGRYWPPGGFLTSAAVSALFATNTTQLVLSSDALPAAPELTFTPSSLTTLPVVGGTDDVAVTDATLDGVVDSGALADPRLAEQRFLAETLLFTEELPSRQRTLVLAPNRRWHPPASYAAALLADTGSVPWMEPVTLAHVFAGTPTDAPREALTYPAAERSMELPASMVASAGRTGDGIAKVESILTDTQTTLARELYLSEFRVTSSAWRRERNRGLRLLRQVQVQLAATRSKVAIVSAGLVTLTSRSGAVPITLANRLSQPVRVELALDAGPHATVTDANQVYLVPANQLHQVQVHLVAQTDGVFPMRTQLFTPTSPPAPYAAAQQLYVRSTAYGALALGISGGAFGALVIAAGVQVARRIRRSRSRVQADAPT